MRDSVGSSRLKRLAELRNQIVGNDETNGWRFDEINSLNSTRKGLLVRSYKTLNLREEIEDFAERLKECNGNVKLRNLYMDQELPVLAVAIAAASGVAQTRYIQKTFNANRNTGEMKFSPISFLIYNILSIDAAYAEKIPQFVEIVKNVYTAESDHLPQPDDDDLIQIMRLQCEIREGENEAKNINVESIEKHANALVKVINKLAGVTVESPVAAAGSGPAKRANDEAKQKRAQSFGNRKVIEYKHVAAEHEDIVEGSKPAAMTPNKIRKMSTLEEVAYGFELSKATKLAYNGEAWKTIWDELKARMMELILSAPVTEKSDLILAITQGKTVGGCGIDNMTAKSLYKLTNYHDKWLTYVASPVFYTDAWKTLSQCKKEGTDVSEQLTGYVNSHRPQQK